MTTALPTMAVSLVYILWDACRRAVRKQPPPPPPADPQPQGDQHIEHRLDFLTVLARPVPRRRR